MRQLRLRPSWSCRYVLADLEKSKPDSVQVMRSSMRLFSSSLMRSRSGRAALAPKVTGSSKGSATVFSFIRRLFRRARSSSRCRANCMTSSTAEPPNTFIASIPTRDMGFAVLLSMRRTRSGTVRC
jgi:hypothetical protein